MHLVCGIRTETPPCQSQTLLHVRCYSVSAWTKGPWIINTNISAWSLRVREFMMKDSNPASCLRYTAGTAMHRALTFRRSAYVI